MLLLLPIAGEFDSVIRLEWHDFTKVRKNLLTILSSNFRFSNALPGLASASADRSPIFVVTSSPPLCEAETNSLQGFHDQVVLARPLTKFAHRVTNVEEIPRITAYAFKVALSGAPGPVLVYFPIDVLFHPPRMDAISYGSMMRAPASSPFPDPESVEKVITLFKEAKRPVIIVGTGAARTTTRGEKTSPLLDLAEAMGSPVFHSQKYAPAIPSDHALRGGPAARLAMLKYIGKEQPDLVLMLGARTGFLLGGRSGAIIPDQAKFVQVDLDGGEIGKSLPVDLGIVSDAGNFIAAVLDRVKKDSAADSNSTSPRESWIEDVQDLKKTETP